MKLTRIKLSRRKGWRMPPNTLKIDRSTRWGNPYRVGFASEAGVLLKTKSICAQEFGRYLKNNPALIEALRAEIERRGIERLACWCKMGEECHGDYWIKELAQL